MKKIFGTLAAFVLVCGFVVYGSTQIMAKEKAGVIETAISNSTNSETCSDTSCEGKHCTYTVGCDCPGFAPCSGDVWAAAYCRRCGHHRKYHR